MPKPKLGYLLFDLPSDHEVESAIATECEVIEALIHNLGRRARVKRICVASAARFKTYPTYRYSVQFVHLACHAGRPGIEMLGGTMSWSAAATQIKKHLHKLKPNARRVIVFSCCHSKEGYEATKTAFQDYFTGAYYFTREQVPFAFAITVWSMFYLKKKLQSPHSRIVDAINTFVGEQILEFNDYS